MKDFLAWPRPAPARFRNFVINGMLNMDPAQRPTPEQCVLEFDGMVECLTPYIDSKGWLNAPHTLASLTATYPPAPVDDADVREAHPEA